VELSGGGNNARVRFYATEPYSFISVDANSALFKSVQAVKVGEFPLGSNIQMMASLDSVGFHIPFIRHESITNGTITVTSIALNLFVNGEPRHTLTVDCLYEARVVPSGPIGWASFAFEVQRGDILEWLLKEGSENLSERQQKSRDTSRGL
jgi:hypothetical protein